MSRRRRWARVAAACCVAAAVIGGEARAQMTLPAGPGKLAADPPKVSVVLGKDLATLRGWWAKPVNKHQESYKASLLGRADMGVGDGKPAKFADSTAVSTTAKCAALRWAMEPDGPKAATDLAKVLFALKNAAIAGGTEITRNEIMTNYLLAYDFTRPAPWSIEDRKEIEANLTQLAESLGGGESDSNVRGKVAGARGLAGVLLHNQALLDKALTELANHFKYSTTDDGWFTDSQGHYLNYTLPHLSTFVRAYHQASGVNLYPSLKPYADMSIALRLPSGVCANVSNGTITPVGIHYFSFTPDVESGANMIWYLTSMAPEAFANTNLTNNDWTMLNSFVLSDFSKPAKPPAFSPTVLTRGQSGVSSFRNDWTSSSHFLLLSPGVDSPTQTRTVPLTFPPVQGVFPAYHSQNDTGEILVALHGVYILNAPGYDRRDLSNAPKDLDPKRADWHNVLLVDGNVGVLPGPAGALPYGETPIAYGGPTLGRATRPGDFTHTDRLDAAERGNFKGAADFATLQMKYNNTQVRRSVAFPNEDYFLVADVAVSDKSHEYGFNLVGRGAQTVAAESPTQMHVQWDFEGVTAHEHLVSTHPMTLKTGQIWHHLHYNTFEKTTRATSSVNADVAGFMAVIEGAKGASGLKVTNRGDAQVTAVEVANAAAGWTDVAFSQAASKERVVRGVGSDARFAYLRRVADGKLHSGMFARGTTLSLDGKLVVTASKPITLSFTLEGNSFKATISPDNFTAGTRVTLAAAPMNPAARVAATLDGKPVTVTNQSIDLPAAGVLIFTAQP